MAIYYTGLPLLILIAVLDATFMHLLRVWGGVPSLFLIVTLSWAMLVELDDALPWAVMGGIVHDLLSVVPTGSSSLIVSLIVIGIHFTMPRLDGHNLLLPPVIVFLGAIAYNAGLFAMMILIGHSLPLFWGAFYIILPSAMWSALLTPFIFRLLATVNNFLRPRRGATTTLMR